ncbi:MAG: hypothetical protein FWD76_04410, partial [Firmicutes bacterium]|nr:hypothetical protein [Bacillota bacterium]
LLVLACVNFVTAVFAMPKKLTIRPRLQFVAPTPTLHDILQASTPPQNIQPKAPPKPLNPQTTPATTPNETTDPVKAQYLARYKRLKHYYEQGFIELDVYHQKLKELNENI